MRCTVVGCGLLGQRIGGFLLYCNQDVTIFDRSEHQLSAAVLSLEKTREELKSEYLVLDYTYQGNLTVAGSLNEACYEADFLFECIVEDLAAKQSFFQQVSKLVPKNCIMTTSTLNYNIDEVAKDTNEKQRLIGVRFVYPVYFMPNVEVTEGTKSHPDTLIKVESLLKQMGVEIVYRNPWEKPLQVTEKDIELQTKEYKKKVRQGHLPKPNNSPTSSTTSWHSLKCLKCNKHPRNCILDPCKHQTTCVACTKLMILRKEKCLLCEYPISKFTSIRDS